MSIMLETSHARDVKGITVLRFQFLRVIKSKDNLSFKNVTDVFFDVGR